MNKNKLVMYVTLFELLLWFIFVRRRKGITDNNLNCKQKFLNSTQWLINFIFLNHLTTISTTNLDNSSAFILNNNSLLDNLIDNNLNNNLPISTISSVNFSNNFLDTTNNLNSQKSSTFTNQSNGPLFRHTFFVSTIFIFAYSIVFIIGLVGNLCVMIVVIRSSRMRNATNFL